jgi:hypothetical protein
MSFYLRIEPSLGKTAESKIEELIVEDAVRCILYEDEHLFNISMHLRMLGLHYCI